jgi:hypothetical protein
MKCSIFPRRNRFGERGIRNCRRCDRAGSSSPSTCRRQEAPDRGAGDAESHRPTGSSNSGRRHGCRPELLPAQIDFSPTAAMHRRCPVVANEPPPPLQKSWKLPSPQCAFRRPCGIRHDDFAVSERKVAAIMGRKLAAAFRTPSTMQAGFCTGP